jgi:CheY-like chemotaxis protein
MPGVDGILATRMIRFLEKEQTQIQHYTTASNSHERQNGNIKQRVAIIAVSASLYEEKRFDYLQSGYILPFLVRVVNRR